MHRLLLQVFRSPWAMEQMTAASYHWAVKSLLDGKLVFESDRELLKPKNIEVNPKPSAVRASTQSRGVKSGVVAVIPINGVLMKDDQDCGPVGMDTIGNWIKQIDNDASVDAILLRIDSPGGTVSGTDQLAEVVAKTRKPIVAFVDDLAASAAYWIASQADLVIASTKKARVGSIGVMMSWIDVQPMWEKEGVVFHDIYADESDEKNKEFKEIRQKKYENYIKDVLNPLRDDFVLSVKNGRSNKIADDSIFKGRLEFADKSITTGLVDQIATFDEAVDITLGLVDTNKPSAKKEIQKPKSLNMNKYARIAALIGVPSLEIADGGVFLTEENMKAIETALESAEGDRTALEQIQNQLDISQGIINGHIATITEHDSTIATLKQEINTLKKNAGAPTAIITAKSDPENKEGKEELVQFCEENADNTAACVERIRESGIKVKQITV